MTPWARKILKILALLYVTDGEILGGFKFFANQRENALVIILARMIIKKLIIYFHSFLQLNPLRRSP
jgi:hypothetical protein